ncbi:MAG: hypothetical protein H6833_13120 [Planctomycetes bacterium]|nr:hypothetical protein [Planctomycetota bacterium]
MSPGRSRRRSNPCLPIQADISSMLDGESDDAAVHRALVHIEVCPRCRDFFEGLQGQMRLHRELVDPEKLIRRIQRFDGADFFRRVPVKDNLKRLAVFFYELGKAYLLMSADQKYLLKVFEESVPIPATASRGRGFVDGVIQAYGDTPDAMPSQGAGDYDWIKARGLLNGELDHEALTREKARLLLEEALCLRPGFAKARLYMGFYHQLTEEWTLAATEYRRVFETTRNLSNRAHAAVQMGVLRHLQGQPRIARRWFRWVVRNGVVRRDSRFYFVYYNLAVLTAHQGDLEKAIAYFDILHERFADRAQEVRGFLGRAHNFQQLLEQKREFAGHLRRRCPSFFEVESPSSQVFQG